MVGHNQPGTVPGPLIGNIAIGIRKVLHCRNHRFRFTGLNVHHHDLGAVLQVSDVFAVGGANGLEGFVFRFQHDRFIQNRAVGKPFFLLTVDGCFVNIPRVVTFSGVVKRTVIVAPGNTAFLLWRVGDSASGPEFNVGYEHFASDDKCDFLFVGRDGKFGGGITHRFHIGRIATQAGPQCDVDLL